ncbi:MAG: cytochrome c [Verrucomicrobia bacterium]|nr:cytochrome c [Verrucomicrobiota bacterium]
MRLGHLRFFAVVLGVALTVGTARAEDWQRKAVEMYPQLGVADSAFSKKFQQLRRQHELSDPNYFNNTQWPVLLAKECAGQLAPENRTKLPATAAPKASTSNKSPASSAMSAGEKLYKAKCGRCHDFPNPGFVAEETWNRWMMRMRYTAGLSDEDYDRLMDYARSQREARQAQKGK